MVYNSIPWKAAVQGDVRYKHFLEHRGNFWPIDRLAAGPKRLMVLYPLVLLRNPTIS